MREEQWERLERLLQPQKPRTGKPNHDHRTIIDGILWINRTGAPWRDLPERYGKWQTVSSRFYRWRKSGIWERVLEALEQQADSEGKLDWEVHYVDSTVVRAHQHAAGAKGDPETEALGRSQGGLSTKIHLRAQGTGKPIAMVVTPGQRHEAVVFEQVMERGAVRRTRGRAKQRPGRIAGDKAYSSRRIRRYLRRRGIRVTIPHKSNERRGQFDKRVYKQRNLVERLINGYTAGPLP